MHYQYKWEYGKPISTISTDTLLTIQNPTCTILILYNSTTNWRAKLVCRRSIDIHWWGQRTNHHILLKFHRGGAEVVEWGSQQHTTTVGRCCMSREVSVLCSRSSRSPGLRLRGGCKQIQYRSDVQTQYSNVQVIISNIRTGRYRL